MRCPSTQTLTPAQGKVLLVVPGYLLNSSENDVKRFYITGALKIPISDELGMTMGLELGQKPSLMLSFLLNLGCTYCDCAMAWYILVKEEAN